jgi:hypothetical protein
MTPGSEDVFCASLREVCLYSYNYNSQVIAQ